MSDSTIIASMRRSAAAAEREAARYRRAGRDDDADAAAKDGRRWLQLAARAPSVFAENDHLASCTAHSAGEEL